MNIPISCGKCRYGNTFDMSIDDLCTYCMVLGYSSDWCDFPNRRDDTLRMRNCPLPNLTKEQIEIAEIRLKEYRLKKIIRNRIFFGKTKLIKKRNLGRARKLKGTNKRKGDT